MMPSGPIAVTGGANGIGQAVIRALAAGGVATACLDLAEPRMLEAQSIFLPLDVTDEMAAERAIAQAEARLGPLAGLVNAAGILGKVHPPERLRLSDWERELRVDLTGTYIVARAAGMGMAARGGGAIVNMSSVNGVLAIPSIASYNVSKGGINQLTRVMALALADKGIRVNAVAPGTIATELAKNAVLGSEEAKQRIMSRTPMKRLGEPGEIADVCAFLVSSAASYMTGEIVYVDGGRLTLNYTVAS